MLIVTDYVTINLDRVNLIAVDNAEIKFFIANNHYHSLELHSNEAALLTYKEIISAYVGGKPIVKL